MNRVPNVELLMRWEASIVKVEQGYILTVYDNTNDLSVRSLLSQTGAATTSLTSAESSKLEELDERFRAATRKSEKPITPGFAGEPWWYYRIPLELCGELLADLREEGHA